jgi:hypothetical protein
MSDGAEFDTADFDGDDRLRALLRGGDPAGSLRPADPAALQSLLEDIMSADLEIRPSDPGLSEPRRRTRATWLVAAAAVAVIAAGGAFAVTGLTGDDADAPQADQQPSTTAQVGAAVEGETTQLTAGSPQAKCAVLTPAVLAQYDQAFQGTVTSVDGDTVTFHATDVYAGQVGETVQLTAPPDGIAKILGRATTFQVGQTYLVPAYQGAVSMCGYSGPATGDLQQIFKEAFVH